MTMTEAPSGLWVPDAELWTPPPIPTGAVFDPERATKAQRWFERILVHTKGRWAGKPFEPRQWQLEELIWPLFGVVRHDEQTAQLVRQYVLAWIELARKNGKSDLLAGIGLFLVIADGEEGAEVYGAAQKMGKGENTGAAIVFRVAKRMCELSPWLRAQQRAGRLRIYERDMRIVWVPTESFYQVIPSTADAALGTNPHGVLFDEVLTQPSRDLWDALKTGMGAREQPMMVAATTAGSDAVGLASEEHLWSERVAREPDLDPARLTMMRNTPRDADWRDEANWTQANPALGDFKSIQSVRNEAREAEGSPAKIIAFRQFHLNQWVRRSAKWLDMDAWDECAGAVDWRDLGDLVAGMGGAGGLDLSSTADFAAWVVVIGQERDAPAPPEVDDDELDDELDAYDDVAEPEAPTLEDLTFVLPRIFLPRAAVEQRSAMRPQLDAWEAEGALTVTPGRVVDYDAIFEQVDQDAQDFDLRVCRYDRWNASQLVRRIEGAGLECEGLAQTTAAMNAPCRELERLLGLTLLRHGGHPILDWMAGNAEALHDGTNNIKPDRKRSAEKIDGVVAMVDGIAGLLDESGPGFAAAGW
jgi:phage terminase large subunit-like protein